MENPKNSTKKLLELINNFSKIAGYKTDTQKLLAFVCTNDDWDEREIIKTIPFTVTSRKIKILRSFRNQRNERPLLLGTMNCKMMYYLSWAIYLVSQFLNVEITFLLKNENSTTASTLFQEKRPTFSPALANKMIAHRRIEGFCA